MSTIDFNEARLKAIEAVKSSIGTNIDEPLQANYREESFGWIFFPRKDIAYAEGSFVSDEAIAVTKTGNVRMIVDLSDDEEKMREYVKNLTEYLNKKGE